MWLDAGKRRTHSGDRRSELIALCTELQVKILFNLSMQDKAQGFSYLMSNDAENFGCDLWCMSACSKKFELFLK